MSTRRVDSKVCSISTSPRFHILSDLFVCRQETAASVTHLVRLLSSNLKTLSSHLRVLDLCTGSGCIPLLFHHEFYFKHKTLAELSDVYLDLVGIDISPIAVELAKENQALQMSRLCSKDGTRSLAHKSLKGAAFLQADILQQEAALAISNPHLSLSKSSQRHQSDTSPISVEYDIIISNPPYISRQDYWRTTTPSVRNFEPKLALVPPESLGTPSIRYDSDLFYHHILRAARQLNTRIVLVEVANLDQAKRVASLAMRQKIWKGVEIWRDDPFARAIDSTSTSSISDGIDNFDVPIVGSGEGRSVLVYRESGEQWLGKSSSGL